MKQTISDLFTSSNLLVIVLMCFSTLTQAVPVAVEEGGQLKGYTGIEIGLDLYRVEFKEGTFATAIGVLDFSTIEEARSASNALLAAFLTTPLYNQNPELTFGCSNVLQCSILTPYELLSDSMLYTFNDNRPSDHFVFRGGHPLSFDTSSGPTTIHESHVFADWTLTVVPVPAAVWLMGTALLGLFGISFRKVQM